MADGYLKKEGVRAKRLEPNWGRGLCIGLEYLELPGRAFLKRLGTGLILLTVENAELVWKIGFGIGGRLAFFEPGLDLVRHGFTRTFSDKGL